MKKRFLEIIFIIFLLIAIGTLSYALFFYRSTCTTDECFNKALQTCSQKQITKVINNNIYKYEITRSVTNNCKLKITFEQAAIGTDVELKNLLEQKSMTCKIPKTEIKKMQIEKLENMLTYCTGPLKEGLYELIIKRMFSNIIVQMSTVLEKIEDVI